jgi:hypothetical protein
LTFISITRPPGVRQGVACRCFRSIRTAVDALLVSRGSRSAAAPRGRGAAFARWASRIAGFGSEAEAEGARMTSETTPQDVAVTSLAGAPLKDEVFRRRRAGLSVQP